MLLALCVVALFFTVPPTTETSTLSLHDALPILLVGQLEAGEIRIVGHLDPGGLEVDQRGGDSAVGLGTAHQQLEGAVDERALGGRRAGRLRESVDVRELERERARLERRNGARR